MTEALKRQRTTRTAVGDSCGFSAAKPQVSAQDIRPEAMALLAEVLARLHDIELPAIQFLASGPGGGGLAVARHFAVACVATLGRTLLVSAGNQLRAGRMTAAGRPTHATARPSSVLIPDTGMPGLYHRTLDDAPFEPAQLAAQSGRSSAKPFRMVVLCSPAPGVLPTALTQSARCHGSIVTVQAGVTRLEVVQATVRQVQHSGGTVLGTVLVDAPRLGLGWGWRRSA